MMRKAQKRPLCNQPAHRYHIWIMKASAACAKAQLTVGQLIWHWSHYTDAQAKLSVRFSVFFFFFVFFLFFCCCLFIYLFVYLFCAYATTTYCAFDIPRKEVFHSVFYSKCKNWVVTDNILSETTFHVCVCALFLNTYCKIIFYVQKWVTYAISIINWLFRIFVLQLFFFFYLISNYWCSITILWPFQQFWTTGLCWKLAS